MERTSKITFVSYLNHNGKAYLFIEAPDGDLPIKEREGKCDISYYYSCVYICTIALDAFINLEGIPVDNLIIRPYIAKDRRHASKPNTSVLFGGSSVAWKEKLILLKFIIINNFMLIFVTIIIFILVLFYYSF